MSSVDALRPPTEAAEDAALLARHGAGLLEIARRSVVERICKKSPLAVELADYPPALRQHRATFVTLTKGGQLRGCIGTPIASRPLVEDVAENAGAAATEDYRFAPLLEAELEMLEIAVSLLSSPVTIAASGEASLFAQLRPGTDGLLLHDGSHQALFLPQVWAHFPDPTTFVAQLKAKAGLPQAYWSPTLTFRRFTSTTISEPPHRGEGGP